MTLDAVRDCVNILERPEQQILIVREQEEHIGWFGCWLLACEGDRAQGHAGNSESSKRRIDHPR